MEVGGQTPARARLDDVAGQAGVTKSIASRILNGSPNLSVRPETRERVLAAARHLGYRPHVGARGISEAKVRATALLCRTCSSTVQSPAPTAT
jgi:DNA-binding LacI/PurR family transcriptional regulator